MTGGTKLTANMYTGLVYLPPDPSTGLRNTEAGPDLLLSGLQTRQLRLRQPAIPA